MQKTPRGSVVAYLPERFADWEAGLACAELNKPDAGYRVLTMSADGTPRRSIGGWTVAADLSPDELPDNARLLMLVGGETWLDGSNDAALRVVDACVARDVPVAAICGACTFLARHGYLDACEHTGNATFEFAELAPAYRGAEALPQHASRGRRGVHHRQRRGKRGVRTPCAGPSRREAVG